MSETTNPISGLAELYMFPYYATQEDYKKATGKDAPPYVSYKPRKHWFDPSAKNSAKRYVTYDQCLVTREDGVTPAVGADRKPVIDQLILLKEDAAEVNIPPTRQYLAGEMPEIAPEIQMPLRALEPGEVFDFGFAGTVIVKRPALLEQAAGPGAFTSADRQLLQAIAEKLGVR